MITSQKQKEDSQQGSKPPGLLQEIPFETNANEEPEIAINLIWKRNKTMILAQLYEDRICTEIEGSSFCISLTSQISFSYSLLNKKIEFQNRETGCREQFTTQQLGKFTLFINLLKNKCSQTDFYDKYQLGTRIGKSKNSQVFTGRRRQDNKVYAIKIHKNGSKARKEIQILKQLHHPNLIFFHQYFCQKNHDTMFIVMEYQDGGTLLNILKTKSLDSKMKFKIVIDMLNALEFLRIKGIVHRDIKPQNILYSKTEGNFKIGDFGLAIRVQDKITKISGTPGYMAPQLFDEDKQSDANIMSDIYSMGLTFYEIFTGKQYYQGENQQKILEKNAKSISLKNKCYQSSSESSIEKKILELMIRSKPQNRKDSCEIMQSVVFKKINNIFLRDRKKSTSSSQPYSDSNQQKDQNFFYAFKKLLRVKTT